MRQARKYTMFFSLMHVAGKGILSQGWLVINDLQIEAICFFGGFSCLMKDPAFWRGLTASRAVTVTVMVAVKLTIKEDSLGLLEAAISR